METWRPFLRRLLWFEQTLYAEHHVLFNMAQMQFCCLTCISDRIIEEECIRTLMCGGYQRAQVLPDRFALRPHQQIRIKLECAHPKRSKIYPEDEVAITRQSLFKNNFVCDIFRLVLAPEENLDCLRIRHTLIAPDWTPKVSILAPQVIDSPYCLAEGATSAIRNVVVRSSSEEAYHAHLSDDWNYRIDPTKEKGRVLIINNDFQGTRIGSEVDVRNMEELWTELGFKVVVTQNLTAQKMLDLCKKFAIITRDVSVIVVIIMSHGGKADSEEYFVGEDGHTLLMKNIISVFTTAGSPHLQGIPKVLMFHAFSGRTHKPWQDNVLQVQENHGIPERDDMIITFPVVPDIVARRNSIEPSSIMNAITRVFMEHAYNTSVLDMLRMVKDALAGKILADWLRIEENCNGKNLFLFPGCTLQQPNQDISGQEQERLRSKPITAYGFFAGIVRELLPSRATVHAKNYLYFNRTISTFCCLTCISDETNAISYCHSLEDNGYRRAMPPSDLILLGSEKFSYELECISPDCTISQQSQVTLTTEMLTGINFRSDFFNLKSLDGQNPAIVQIRYTLSLPNELEPRISDLPLSWATPQHDRPVEIERSAEAIRNIVVYSSTKNAYQAHLCDDQVYHIVPHQCKGRVLIISNNLRRATVGSEVDMRSMKELWGALGFEITVSQNLTAQQMLNSCHQFARNTKFVNIVVVIVVGYGGKSGGREYFIGNDYHKLLVEDLLSVFNSNDLPHLQDTPKVFLLQDLSGVMQKCDREDIGTRAEVKERAHMLITFLTQQRNTAEGSWLLDDITTVFMECAKDLHIVEMLDDAVKQRMPAQSQTIYQENYLKKKLFLFPGWPLIFVKGGSGKDSDRNLVPDEVSKGPEEATNISSILPSGDLSLRGEPKLLASTYIQADTMHADAIDHFRIMESAQENEEEAIADLTDITSILPSGGLSLQGGPQSLTSAFETQNLAQDEVSKGPEEATNVSSILPSGDLSLRGGPQLLTSAVETQLQQRDQDKSGQEQKPQPSKLCKETALRPMPGKKDRIIASQEKNAHISKCGGEIEVGGCTVTFPFGCFNDATKVCAKAEIDSSKWPPRYICIVAMLWVECQRKLLAGASVTITMQSWCMNGVDSNKIEVHILHQKKDSSTWHVIGSLPLNDLKSFQFECTDFSPYILGIPESEFPPTKLVIDGHVFAGRLNDYTLAFFLQHPLIEQYVREEMAQHERKKKLPFNSLKVELENKILAYLDSTDKNFQFPRAFRESFKVDSDFVRLQRKAFFHSFLNRHNNQAMLISFRCGVQKNDISVDGPHDLRCLWTSFPGEPVTEEREIPQQAPEIPEARLEARGPKIHLSWCEPEVGGRLTYCINVYCDGQRCEAQPLETPDTNIDYSKIKPSSKYYCQVWAVNSRGVKGEKTWSNSVQTCAVMQQQGQGTTEVTAEIPRANTIQNLPILGTRNTYGFRQQVHPPQPSGPAPRIIIVNQQGGLQSFDQSIGKEGVVTAGQMIASGGQDNSTRYNGKNTVVVGDKVVSETMKTQNM